MDDGIRSYHFGSNQPLGRFLDKLLPFLLLNAVVAFWQEHKADNAISLLKQRLVAKAHVFRDGKWTELAARER